VSKKLAIVFKYNINSSSQKIHQQIFNVTLAVK